MGEDQPEIGAQDEGVGGESQQRSSARKRASEISPFRCKNLIAVLEQPNDMKNVGSVIRNANALGVEKVYIVDPRRSLPDDWQDLRSRQNLRKLSASASKWTFVKRFDDTDSCFDHLEKKGVTSIATSPHGKGKVCQWLHEADFTPYSNLAIWFGAEGSGLSDRAVERSRSCVAIPMFGMIESFNLGTSSGIVLYEVTKQRRAYQSRFRFSGRRGGRRVPLPTVMSPNPTDRDRSA